jgi:EamA domain-containing membrane protein RarD
MRLTIPWTLLGYLAGILAGGALASIIWAGAVLDLEIPGFYSIMWGGMMFLIGVLLFATEESKGGKE